MEKVGNINIGQTLLINIVWGLFVGLMCASIGYCVQYSSSLTEESLRLIFTVFMMAYIIKGFAWIGWPDIIYHNVEDGIRKMSKKKKVNLI